MLNDHINFIFITIDGPPMLAATLYQLNSDRNHILWNIVSTERYTFYMQVFMECCYKWKVHNFLLSVVKFIKQINVKRSYQFHLYHNRWAANWWNNDIRFNYKKQTAGLVYSTNKTDHHDITEILLTVALKTINLPTSNSKSIINSINKLCLYCIYYYFSVWNRLRHSWCNTCSFYVWANLQP
jgi:hypothetical protein